VYVLATARVAGNAGQIARAKNLGRIPKGLLEG
jgi:hypothetical protein